MFKFSCWRTITRTVGFLGLAALAACQDEVVTTSPEDAAASRQASETGQANGRGRGLEEEGPLGRLAANNPEFGGWFQDQNGDVSVWVVNPQANAGKVRAAVAQAIAQEPRDAAEKASYAVKVLPAQYSFMQLSDWRDSLSTRFEVYPGMRWIDVDDVRNRVSVAVDSRRTRGLLRSDAARMGIPSGSLNVMTVRHPVDECTPEMIDCNSDPCAMDPYARGCGGGGDPCSVDPYASGCQDPCSIDPSSAECAEDPCVINPDDPACSSSSEPPAEPVYSDAVLPQEVPGTLSQRFAQLQGGIQIAYENYEISESLECTLGFVANSATRGVVVVTNAHCSNDLGSTDGTVYGQPTTANTPWGSDWFGQEVYDPPLRYGWGCFLGCRNSDANFVSTSFSGFGRPYAFGKVARPIGPRTSISDTTTRLNTSSPQLTISRESRPSLIGSTIHKIGRTTGWTRGRLTYYCRKERGYYCQDGANYVYRHGDSGSPVFVLYTNGTIGLIGVHHSKLSNWNFNESIYSPLSRIRRDLGSFQTYPGGPWTS
jgi:hypothetical protein